MTTQPLSNSYDIPKTGYVAFDAYSLRQLIIDRLNEQGIFTDQNFLGSNLASIIDIVAYSYNTLIYYLNKTATESMFTEAQLYENMNRIVKLIDYSPIGAQTSTLSFGCSATTLQRGFYTIPRYSYILINSIPFSFNEDIIFSKTQNSITENLAELSQQKLLYQGIYNEYPVYTALGNTNETLLVDTASQTIDHFNINVYVKSFETNTWKQYVKTSNLYLEDGYAEKYEIRLNSNNRYEIKFGNNINGKQLTKGDQIAVYYLVSNANQGEVGPNSLNTASTLLIYSTVQYNQILNDVNTNNYRYLTQSETVNLIFENSSGSTAFQNKEDTEDIRLNAPSVYKSQYRLVTTSDYEAFVKTNFANLFADVKVINNWDYVSGYLKYFYDIGLTSPTSTNRALFNQIQYADSCNFNNIYLILIPKISTLDSLNYLLPAQKELINSTIQATKMATAEVSFIDPSYKAITFGVQTDLTTPINIVEDTFGDLILIKKANSRRDDLSIITEVADIFQNYFSRENIKLGQTVDLRFLTQQILEIKEIESFYTANTENYDIKTQGLSFYVWNPLYPENDVFATQNNIPMRFFEYPYFFDISNITNRIKITAAASLYSAIEY